MAPRTHEQFVADQTGPVRAVVSADLSGKTLVLTGANTGLGFEAAKHFRNDEPCTAGTDCERWKIQAETGYTRAEFWILDLANFDSVVAFADRIDQELERLDILVENAGIATWDYEQVEWVGENCIRSIQGLLSFASDVHYRTTIERDVISSPGILAKLSDKEYCTEEVMKHRYLDSKLLNVLFTRALQLHVPSSEAITVNSVNPWTLRNILRQRREQFAFTTEEGSRQLVYGAVGSLNDEEKLRGKYIRMSEVVEESDFEEMLEILGKIDPKVSEVAHMYLAKA
ncbi:hypothetical protein IW261DRAFT_1550534 [Armillaria novae-zelandiae]|uniref:NAD(P)-binding protein n=1 Tax=Armillaria novae-zelandiae TaxID=153914 RepID=A0AA39UGB9_9AGAR|nr:hypothetical protein IW261DRAFT_1550534 [Armillaria novae-zelandiae]